MDYGRIIVLGKKEVSIMNNKELVTNYIDACWNCKEMVDHHNATCPNCGEKL